MISIRQFNSATVHHFADDTKLFHTSKSVKNLNKLVNRDMKHLNNWLSANKISLNAEKTELVIFKACVCYFHQIFIFSPNDSLSKTVKNAFYSI